MTTSNEDHPGRIVVVGSANTDMVVKVPRLPGPGETVLGGTFYTAAGGKGANQAVAAARAGGAVTFIACVGDDALGEQAVQGFRADGIDTTYVFTVPKTASGVALIMVDEAGENSIAVASGANRRLRPHHVAQAQAAIAEADVLLVQLEIPMDTVAAAAEMAATHNTRVVLNPAPAQPLDAALLANLSVVTPNRSEAALLTGFSLDEASEVDEAAIHLINQGVDAVLVTLGAEGVYAATPDIRLRLPAFEVTVEDTTAAGDVFNGALAVALAEGQPLREAARFASAAAALSVTRRGAQPSAPRRHEILRMLG